MIGVFAVAIKRCESPKPTQAHVEIGQQALSLQTYASHHKVTGRAEAWGGSGGIKEMAVIPPRKLL